MCVFLIFLAAVHHCCGTAARVLFDLGLLGLLALRSRRGLAAENLFLRKQLALFQERKVRPRRADDSTRWMMATLGRMFPWHDALVNVKPDTLRNVHRRTSFAVRLNQTAIRDVVICSLLSDLYFDVGNGSLPGAIHV